MSDLLDRKLKKINQDAKYSEVPFDQRYMHKSVMQSLRKKPLKQAHWGKRSRPLAIIIILLFSIFHLNQAEPDKGTAGMMTEKSNVPELKPPTTGPDATFASHPTNKPSSTSRMIQKTYVIHEDKQFVQTEKSVTSEQLGEVIGTIGPQSPGEGERTLESVTPFQPATKIYRIKGDAPDDKIAIQSWRSTGIGTTPVTRQGYFVFEKSRDVTKEDG